MLHMINFKLVKLIVLKKGIWIFQTKVTYRLKSNFKKDKDKWICQ